MIYKRKAGSEYTLMSPWISNRSIHRELLKWWQERLNPRKEKTEFLISCFIYLGLNAYEMCITNFYSFSKEEKIHY